MTYSLAGITAKIRRAEESMNQLHAAISAYIGANYRCEGTFNTEDRGYVLRAIGEPQLPDAFAVTVGEILYNLRSTFDHAVTQLAAIGDGTARAERLEFPVCDTPDKFARARAAGKISGLPAAAQTTIESLQPYNTHTPAEAAILYWIHELNRIDKHRLLLVAGIAVEPATVINIASNAPEIHVIGIRPPPPAGVSPTQEGTEVFGMQFGEAYDPNINLTANYGFRVSFNHSGIIANRPIMEILHAMGTTTAMYMRDLFPEFTYP